MTDINDSTVWNEVDSSNITGVPSFPEGMAPSMLNDDMRAVVGGVRRWYVRINATVTSTGGANSQILNYSVGPTQYKTGDLYLFIAGYTNTGPTTLKLNALSDLTVQVFGTPCIGGELVAGQIAMVCYDGTHFQLLNPEGRVGVGDLHVAGDIYGVKGIFSDDVSVGGDLTVAGDETLTGDLHARDIFCRNITATGNGSFATLEVSGDADFDGTVNTDGDVLTVGGGLKLLNGSFYTSQRMKDFEGAFINESLIETVFAGGENIISDAFNAVDGPIINYIYGFSFPPITGTGYYISTGSEDGKNFFINSCIQTGPAGVLGSHTDQTNMLILDDKGLHLGERGGYTGDLFVAGNIYSDLVTTKAFFDTTFGAGSVGGVWCEGVGIVSPGTPSIDFFCSGVFPGPYWTLTSQTDSFMIDRAVQTGSAPSASVVSQTMVTVSNVGDMTIFGSNYNTSDIRIKNILGDIPDALAKVLALKGVRYSLKDGPDTTARIGFIADDVLPVVPELVNVPENPEEMKTMSYAHMVALVVEGFKEFHETEHLPLVKKVADLESRLAALEAKG